MKGHDQHHGPKYIYVMLKGRRETSSVINRLSGNKVNYKKRRPTKKQSSVDYIDTSITVHLLSNT